MLLPVLFSLAYHNKIHKLKSTIKVSVDFVSDESYLPDLQIAEKDRQTESTLSLSLSLRLSLVFVLIRTVIVSDQGLIPMVSLNLNYLV